MTQGKRGFNRVATPLQMALSEFLSDGQWHSYDEVYRALGQKIPAGKAHRRAERLRQKRPGAPATRARPVSDEHLIELGRRNILGEACNTGLTTGSFEIRGERGAKEVRQLRPPPAVAYTLSLGENVFDPRETADRLLNGHSHERSLMLGDLTMAQLRSLCRVLLDRIAP